MRFMVLVRATTHSEAGVMPGEQLLAAIANFNQELVKAGVLLAGGRLHPCSTAARVRFSGGKTTLIDGPFAATAELVAGFWLIEVRSRDEAIEWVRRVPIPPDSTAEVEIRQAL